MSVLDDLAGRVDALRPGARVRVGVDGVDCSGKTTLADALAARLARPVVRASVDDFLRPAAERHRRGRTSPEGCYRDTTDLDALRRELLDPFAVGRPHRTRTWSRVADEPEPGPLASAPPDAVLLVDGVFLQRPELAPAWDLVVLLQVPVEEVLRRARVRDAHLVDVEALYRARYLPAQDLYVAEVDPAARADVVLDSTDPSAPVLLRG